LQLVLTDPFKKLRDRKISSAIFPKSWFFQKESVSKIETAIFLLSSPFKEKD